MKQVYIMSGLPGSGKSTWAQKLAHGGNANDVRVISSDDYFMVGDRYIFDPMKIGLAHQDCFKRFMAEVMAETPLVIVDNTCIEPWEISPYLLFASSFDYQVMVKEVHASLEDCVNRNTHGVPYHVIRSMHSRFQTRTLPAHWRVEGVFTPSSSAFSLQNVAAALEAGRV